MNDRKQLRTAVAIGAISVLAIAVTACGGGSGESAATTTTSTPETTSAEPTSAGTSSALNAPSTSLETSAPEDLTKIRIGIGADTASYGALYVCDDLDIFEKHGLEAEIQTLKTSSQLLAAVVSDSIQIGGGVGTALLAGALQDEPVRIIAMDVPVYGLAIWGDSAIPDLNGLVGKKLAVSPPGSLSANATDRALADNGLTDKVELVHLADSSAGAAALAQGAVDAVVSAPDRLFSAAEAGEDVHLIFDFTKYRTAGQVYGVTQSYIESNGDAVQKYVDALAECLKIVHSDKDTTIQSLMKHTGIKNADTARQTYDFWNNVWGEHPTVDSDLIKAAVDSVAAKTGATPPDDVTKFIDATFAERYAR